MTRTEGMNGGLTVLICLLVLAACGCGGTTAPEDESVLAVYRGGRVTTHDLDQAILAMPPTDRQVEPDQVFDRDRGLIESIVLDRILLERADAENILLDPGFSTQHSDNRQRVVADFFINTKPDLNPGVSEEEIRDYYQGHRSDFRQSAQRHTLNIFLRSDPGFGPDAAIEEIEKLRLRVISGESFGILAREYSDSETAERDGDLGWLSRDSVPKGLADVVFALEPGVPSRPVVTTDGVHIFLVVSSSPDREYTFDEVRAKIMERLNAKARRILIAETVENLPRPEPFTIPNSEDLEYLVESGDPEVEVFQIGESFITVGSFRAMLDRANRSPGSEPRADQARDLLDALVQRALIFEHCRSIGLFEDPDLSSRLERLYTHDATAFMREKGLTDEARLDQEGLADYYANHRQRFSSPLVVDFGVLVVPMPDGGTNDLMRDLSALDLDGNPGRLDRAALRFGGNVERVEKTPLAGVQRWNAKLARLLSVLDVGSCSEPVRVGQSIIVVELDDRVEPEPIPFEVVRDKVVRAYVDDHRQDLYRRWTLQNLEDAEFRVFDDRLADFALRDRSVDPGGSDRVPEVAGHAD